MKKKKIFSGVQPTGNLHLGNYLGAIKNFVALQKGENDCIYCVVDLHAITVKHDPKELKQNKTSEQSPAPITNRKYFEVMSFISLPNQI